jgi:hypothetical protein
MIGPHELSPGLWWMHSLKGETRKEETRTKRRRKVEEKKRRQLCARGWIRLSSLSRQVEDDRQKGAIPGRVEEESQRACEVCLIDEPSSGS